MEYNAGKYDVAVIGAGHAGCEAGLACARMGFKTLVFSISLEAVANMPCNPHIGGSSKGHLVKELDCLGGEMGKNIDKTYTQIRMLNTSKGPAVYSLRAQADRKKYQAEMKHTLEKQKNLYLKQAEIVDIGVENDKVTYVKTNIGAIYHVSSVILATGTYLKGKIFIGETSYESGPDGVFPSNRLSDILKKLGINLVRFKTGTPARVLKSSIDYSKFERQDGDNNIQTFSFLTKRQPKNTAVCYLGYTNEKTHEIIRKNLYRAPMYSGMIKGVGPRYCPSIEDKVVRFADKTRHQIFLEPEDEFGNEIYVQGFSSSMPRDVQEEMYKSVEGFEDVKILRNAYAIEYDCISSLDLLPTLESKIVENLFFAGQINGTSGYEEAAAQGLIAGINASNKINNKEPLILRRDQAYIGVLIDDLVTKGTNEPYRMMTSRAEYRLLLRQDNADIRLTEIGRTVGLVDDYRYKVFKNKIKKINQANSEINKKLDTKKIKNLLIKKEESFSTLPTTAKELLKRNNISIFDIKEEFGLFKNISNNILKYVETEVKYEGYLKRQELLINQMKKNEDIKLDKDFDYNKIKGLRIEARQKLNKFKPLTLGQASRISGVSPADISVLTVYLSLEKRKK